MLAGIAADGIVEFAISIRKVRIVLVVIARATAIGVAIIACQYPSSKHRDSEDNSQIPGTFVVGPAIVADGADDIVPTIRHIGCEVLLARLVVVLRPIIHLLQLSRLTRTFWHCPFQRVSLHMKMEA